MKNILKKGDDLLVEVNITWFGHSMFLLENPTHVHEGNAGHVPFINSIVPSFRTCPVSAWQKS